jgi:hypothetical protein
VSVVASVAGHHTHSLPQLPAGTLVYWYDPFMSHRSPVRSLIAGRFCGHVSLVAAGTMFGVKQLGIHYTCELLSLCHR